MTLLHVKDATILIPMRHVYNLLLILLSILLLQSTVQGAGDEFRKGFTLMRYVEQTCDIQSRPITWSAIAAQEKWKLNEYKEPSIDPRMERLWGDRKLDFRTIVVKRDLTEEDRQLYNVDTQSSYGFKMNIAAGLMVVEAAYHYNDSKTNMSQIMVAIWKREFDTGGSAAGQPVKPIDIVVRKRITNLDSSAALSQALKSTGGDLPFNQTRVFKPFPAATSLALRNGFYTAVGTPNGKPQAFLLAQHRDLWGPRTIESVEVLNLGAGSSASYYVKFAFTNFDPKNPPDRDIPARFQMEVEGQDEEKWWRGCGCAVM